jgi:hypothetical protein
VAVLLNSRTETAKATLGTIDIPGAGTHSVKAAYAGSAEFTASTSAAIQLKASPIATTLALKPSAGSSVFGKQLQLTATLDPYYDASLTTTGETVTFYRNGVKIGSGSLSSGVAKFNIASLPVGSDVLTAAYAGNTDFASATSSPVTVVVSAAVPTVTRSAKSLTFPSTAGGSSASVR